MTDRDPERVIELRDDAIGLVAFIAIDSTRRGPAFGGIRRARYPDLAAARADACALARAMTYKCALAELPAGGGKTVVVDDGRAHAWSPIYAALGAAIEALGGAYVCGPDVGTGPAELAVVREQTRHCNPADNDASAATAAGVLAALRAVWPRIGGPTGARALVQGLGGVGSIVARELVALGVETEGCDRDADACTRARARGIAIVGVDEALVRSCDVLVPCAMGGVIGRASVASLGARAICGCANNQLADRDTARALMERGIVHVPDIVASAGAVIEGVRVVLDGDTPAVRERVRAEIAAIEARAAAVLSAAIADERPPSEVADAWAAARVHAVA